MIEYIKKYLNVVFENRSIYTVEHIKKYLKFIVPGVVVFFFAIYLISSDSATEKARDRYVDLMRLSQDVLSCQSSLFAKFDELSRNVNPYALHNSPLEAAVAPYARQLEMTPPPPYAELLIFAMADALSISMQEAALLITGNGNIKKMFAENPEIIKQIEDELKNYKTPVNTDCYARMQDMINLFNKYGLQAKHIEILVEMTKAVEQIESK